MRTAKISPGASSPPSTNARRAIGWLSLLASSPPHSETLNERDGAVPPRAIPRPEQGVQGRPNLACRDPVGPPAAPPGVRRASAPCMKPSSMPWSIEAPEDAPRATSRFAALAGVPRGSAKAFTRSQTGSGKAPSTAATTICAEGGVVRANRRALLKRERSAPSSPTALNEVRESAKSPASSPTRRSSPAGVSPAPSPRIPANASGSPVALQSATRASISPWNGSGGNRSRAA